MNYVRKLGFEESPDYDFLRELFSKVLKNIGEQDDGIFDWMLINNGKGWEAGNVKSLILMVDACLNRIFPDACIIAGAGPCNC
jgi:casein kinase 1